MAVAQILMVAMLFAAYLASCAFLLADTVPPMWALSFIALHILYSWGIVWLYAYLRAGNKICWAALLIPALTTTSTLGFVIWVVFQPEKRIRSRVRF
jgi:quinol-cytochrome oxidoreductase complex cytochrome b subunit